MCRVLAYLGPSLPVADLLLRPANSLVHQSFDPKYKDLLQLSGSGFASWEQGSLHEREPLLYKSATPPRSDPELRAICGSAFTTALLAHVRAVKAGNHAPVDTRSCHPFIYPGYRLALAHNGELPGWPELRDDILEASRPEVVANLAGPTDTEALYCLLMSQFDDPKAELGADEIRAGIEQLMSALLAIKRRNDNTSRAKLKLFLANGNSIVVANIGLGVDYATTIDRTWDELHTFPVWSPEFELAGVVEPVWYLAGRDFAKYGQSYDMAACDPEDADTMIVASEPLAADRRHWQSIPFQHIATIERHGDRLRARVEPWDFPVMVETPALST